MARYRRKRYKRFSKRPKGIMKEISLYFTSRARVKGAVAGMLVSPLIVYYTDFGNDVARWIVAQSQKLTGR